MKPLFALALCLGLLAACSGASGPPAAASPVATVPLSVKETQVASVIYATLTASVPKATNTPLASDTPENTPTPLATAPPQPTIAPLVLKGNGQQVSSKFNLNAGLAVFQFSYKGTANFIVNLLNSSGDLVDGLTNEIGSFQGAQAVGIDKGGTHILDVKASAPWVVTVTQPIPAGDEQGPPVTFKGKGKQVTPFFTLPDGLTIFKLKHNGKSNFIVELLHADGQLQDGLVNEIGAFDGSKAEGIHEPGAYIMNVIADGDWTISLEQ